MATPGPEVTIVIPTRDRHASLTRTAAAIVAQRTRRSFEVVVVDDGSTPPVSGADLPGLSAVRVVLGPHRMAAGARNAGIAAARAPVVLFTDDDTEPEPGWLDAAVEYLHEHPDHVGVEGVVTSPPWDPLHEYSISTEAPGAYLTCNIAFRRDVLRDIGGFDDESFPMHCEDVDLALRARRLGPIGFEPRMRILHHPRRLTLRQAVRRGRMAGTEVALFRRHREHFGRAARLPAPLFPLVSAVAFVLELGRGTDLRSPRRLARFAAYAAGYVANVAIAVALTVLGSRRPQVHH